MFTERIAAAGDGLQFVQNADEDRSKKEIAGVRGFDRGTTCIRRFWWQRFCLYRTI